MNPQYVNIKLLLCHMCSHPLIMNANQFGEGSGNQFTVRGCSGTEKSIESCTVSSASSPCGSHSKDVSIICSKLKKFFVVLRFC